MEEKSKVIITNESDLPMSAVLRLVDAVIIGGRVSNGGKQYAYLTAFSVGESQYHVVTDLNKHSDKFIIYNVHSAALN